MNRKKGIAIFALCAAAAGTVGGFSFIGSEFDMPSVRIETITVSSDGVVGFSDGEGRDYEMESPVKFPIVPSWRYSVSGRWELRGGYPTRVVSEDGVDMLEVEIRIPKSWGGAGQRAGQGKAPLVKLPGGKKLVTVTWNGGEMRFLTRNMRKGDLVETYEFHDAAGGGKITVEETLPPRPW